MYKEILIIAIIILVISSLNIITQNYTKDSVAILSENLIRMKEDFLQEEKNQEKLNQDIANTFQEWDKDMIHWLIILNMMN